MSERQRCPCCDRLVRFRRLNEVERAVIVHASKKVKLVDHHDCNGSQLVVVRKGSTDD